MLANELIDRLEGLGLLDQEIIEALREQLLSGGVRVTPEAVAKLLVDNGQLTKFQATKLIGELRADDYNEGDAAEAVEVDEDSDNLAMLDGEIDTDVVEAAEAVDVFEAEPVEVMAVEAEPVAVEAVPVEAEPVDVMSMGDGGSSPPSGSRPRPVKKQEPGTWDSFKIYGYAGIIVFLILSGIGLWWVLSKDSADDVIASADKMWDQSSWQQAQEAYTGYLDSYGQGDPNASKCRTRLIIAELYRTKDARDPTKPLKLAQEKLPQIKEEQWLNSERSNLAGLLVEIARKIAEAAEDAEATEDKKMLLGSLQEQRALLEDSNYVTSTDRTNLKAQIDSINETRDRVRREIKRNLELESSVTTMTAALDQKDTKKAYDIRQTLVREFPELKTNERVVGLVRRACDLQKDLVNPSAKLPKVTEPSEVKKESRSISLVAGEGGTVTGLENQTMYRRVGGSVLAMSCADGQLKWRRFVGYGQNHRPVRLPGSDGVLLSDSSTLSVQRCDGDTGEVLWQCSIDEPFYEPIAERSGIFVSTESGRLILLNADSGEPKWVQELPQPLDVTPCVDSIGGRIYLPGDHSNLYVLNISDGSCDQSVYVEHAKGTIEVPPVLVLGHLFVFENQGSDYTMVHIYRVNEDKTLDMAQAPEQLIGNVVVTPEVQKRRVVILTDLGQISAMEVEPTAETDKVKIVASQAPSVTEPVAGEMAVDGSQMWVSADAIQRFELQINTGRVVPNWVKSRGDTFIDKPFVIDDTLFHSRVLQGTQAIRITAAEVKKGDEIWRSDVGVPIAMLAAHAETNAIHAVTSQGALFIISKDELMSGQTRRPSENPGKQGINMRFEAPIRIDATRRIMLNGINGMETVVYDPTRPREWLRKVVLASQGGRPSGQGAFAAGGLFVPMSTGRAILMDFQTGQVKSSPFQPPSDPVGEVTWTDPLIHPDDPDQVIISDSRKMLYRLRVGEQINALSKTQLETPLMNQMTLVDKTIVAVTSGPAADFLVGYDATSLKETFRTLLDGRVTWGPSSADGVDGLCFLQTADGALRSFDANGKQKYQLNLPKGTPVANPIFNDGNVLLGGSTGWVVSFDAATGNENAQLNVGQGISAAPLVWNGFLLIPGVEGVVFIERL